LPRLNAARCVPDHDPASASRRVIRARGVVLQVPAECPQRLEIGAAIGRANNGAEAQRQSESGAYQPDMDPVVPRSVSEEVAVVDGQEAFCAEVLQARCADVDHFRFGNDLKPG